MSTRHRGQYDIYNPELDKNPKIVIVWAWGIWSTTAYALAQMWLSNITVIDYDEVENHNVASQFYKESDLWKLKTESLKNNIKEFTWVEIKTINDKYRSEFTKDADIVIIAVDNMKTRREVVESLTTKTIRFIDWRMAWRAFELYNYIPVYENEIYFKTRFTDEEASPVTCTNKSVSFNTFAIASIISRFVIGIIKDEKQIMNKSQITVDLQNLMIA